MKKYFLLSRKENCKIVYPEDVAVRKEFEWITPTIKELQIKFLKDELILDIGPKSITDIINDH